MEFDSNMVSWQRPEYKEQLAIWSKVRDAAAGEEAIKRNRERYLPRLNGHTRDAEGNAFYDLYLLYAHWYGATARTLAGLRGLVFRKDPLKQVPDMLRRYEDNITADGQSLMSFTKDVLNEVLQTNRCGIFIDFPPLDVDVEYSELELEQANIRPYTRMYKAENIINWRTDVVNNETITSLVVLVENIEDYQSNGFEIKYIPQYRVLYLDEFGIYHQRIYQELEANPAMNITGGKTLIEDITPMVNGEYLTTIPFYTITDKGITWDISNPTILGLVDTNISHYMNSANRENALIWTGNPTPVFSGYSGATEDGSIDMGSTKAIILENGGTAQFLEFTGQGINPIKEVMLEKEEEMAVLGARIISPEKRSAETAESASIHRAGEQGVLADIANSISDGLTRILRFFGNFHGIKDTKDIWIKLNTDYMPVRLDANTLKQLSSMVTNGTISWETYIYQLQQGEILPLGVTASDELDRVKKNKDAVNRILFDAQPEGTETDATTQQKETETLDTSEDKEE